MASPLQSEVVTPDQLRDRVGCAYLIYPVQGVRAAGLQLTLLIYARIWKSGCINYTIFVVHTVSFVFIDVELTTPEGVHWRKSTRKWPVSGPVLEGRGALAPLRGKWHTQTIHRWTTNIGLVCACQGMASPLQSKLSPQISCATGLGCAYLIYPVQGCPRSWSAADSPNLCTNLKLGCIN